MSLTRFLASSLSLSFPVLLRMLPIFIMTGVILFGAVYALLDYPGYLFFAAAIAFFPLLAFLFICSIRAGLVHRRQSRGPELAKLVRKSLLVGAIQAGLGIFYAVLSLGAIALTLRPQSLGAWRDLQTTFEAGKDAGQSELETLMSLNPAAVYALLAAFLIYLAIYVALSVPIAAHSASAAVNGPRHEFFFGLGRKFVPLTIVGLISVAVSYIGPVVLAAAVFQSVPVDFTAMMADELWSSANIPVAIYLGGYGLLTAWTSSFYGAACAVAYIDVRDHLEQEHQIAMGSILANTGPQTDLAEMMRERTARLRAAAPKAVPLSGAFDDIDEPVMAASPADDDLFEGVAPISVVEADPHAPLVLEPEPLSDEQLEERFQSRFGNETGSALRTDLSSALREAAAIEAPPVGSEELDTVDPASLIPAAGAVALEPEQVPPVEPDLHEAVPESDDAPEWLRKYMGNDADKTIFGEDNK